MAGPLDDYWASLQEGCDELYEVAAMARAQGRDPRNFVEIPQAADLADRVQKLLEFLHERRTAEQIVIWKPNTTATVNVWRWR